MNDKMFAERKLSKIRRNGPLLVAGLDPFDDILHRGVAQLLHRLVDLAALRGQLQPRLLDSLQSFVVHRFVSFSGASIMQIIRICKYFAFSFSVKRENTSSTP